MVKHRGAYLIETIQGNKWETCLVLIDKKRADQQIEKLEKAGCQIVR